MSIQLCTKPRKHVARPVTSAHSTPGKWVYCEACERVKLAKAPWPNPVCHGPRKRRVQWPDEVSR